MKHRLALIPLTLSLLVGGEAAIAQTYPSNAFVCTNGPRLNLRQAPDGPVLTTLNNGTPLERVAPPAGPWQPVATSSFRGYVWTDFTCSGFPNMAPANPPRVAFQPAMCPNNVELARNVTRPAGLNVYRAPNPNSEIVSFLNEGAAIILGGTNATLDNQGGTWLPLEQPAQGYIRVGGGGIVTNIGYCTRFYP